MFLLGGGLGMILTGLNLPHRFRCTSVAAGLVVILATLLLSNPGGAIPNAFGAGTVERVAAYGITAWLVAMGLDRVP